ncbi:MAG: hypothetical protein O2856_08065 [Planctomycetota bacterium]|nr:hypothetical protein [Planctomycetota bacterium]
MSDDNPYSAPETETAVQYGGAESGELVVRVFSLLLSIVGSISVAAFLVGLLNAAVAGLVLALVHVIVVVLPTAIIGCFVGQAVCRDGATQREAMWLGGAVGATSGIVTLLLLIPIFLWTSQIVAAHLGILSAVLLVLEVAAGAIGARMRFSALLDQVSRGKPKIWNRVVRYRRAEQR